jgi:hypothetical protein
MLNEHWKALKDIPWKRYYNLGDDFPDSPFVPKPKPEPVLLRPIEPMQIHKPPISITERLWELGFWLGAGTGVVVIGFALIMP